MTSPTSLDVREVIFINERCRVDYEDLPEDVKESADQAIDAIQNGRKLSPKLHVPLKGKLSGASEIKLPYDDDTYRIYLTLVCPWIVMVLDAGAKKSTEGSNIPKWQQERLEDRFKRTKDYCKDNEAELRTDFNNRTRRRDTKDKAHGRKK